MPFMMMWTPYHYWNAMFAWQKNIADLMSYTPVKQREPKVLIAPRQDSPVLAAAGNLVVGVSEIETKDTRTGQSPAKISKPLTPRRRPASKKLKQSQKNGSAKAATVRGRRSSGARA